jgi:drug/metabolite transporter (DMT)-like permease
MKLFTLSVNSAIVLSVELLIGQLLALATAFCWAQNSLIYSYVGKQISSATTAHIRLWIALPMIIAVHMVFEGTPVPQNIPLQAYILIGLSGILGFFVADLFIFSGFVTLGARQTMVIMTTSPIVGAILSWVFYQEILKPLQIAGILLTLLGVIWVVIADGSNKGTNTQKSYALGILAAFGGAITQAMAMVLAKAGMTAYEVSPISANVIRISAGLFGLAVFAMARGGFAKDFGKFQGKAGHKALILITLAAIVGPVLGIILNLQALTMAPVGVVTTLSQTTPIILIPLEVYFMKRPVSRSVVLGTLMAIAGTALLFILT